LCNFLPPSKLQGMPLVQKNNKSLGSLNRIYEIYVQPVQFLRQVDFGGIYMSGNCTMHSILYADFAEHYIVFFAILNKSL